MNSLVRNLSVVRDVSSDDFRGAMRHLAGGVSVITAGRGKEITGMTMTSVSSLSVDPPTLIVSVNREASSWPVLKRHGFFGINILAADQLEIAERFSGKGGLKGAERFAGSRNGADAHPARRCWSELWRRSIARWKRRSSGTRTPSSSAASSIFLMGDCASG